MYNEVRLHGAIPYISPSDKLAGRGEAIQAACDAKFAAAREARRPRRQRERVPACRMDSMRLTMTESRAIRRPAGETEAGSAGTQPARDSRPGVRPPVDAGIRLPRGRRIAVPLAGRSSPMPQKIQFGNTKDRPAGGRGCSVAEAGVGPVQAEAVEVCRGARVEMRVRTLLDRAGASHRRGKLHVSGMWPAFLNGAR